MIYTTTSKLLKVYLFLTKSKLLLKEMRRSLNNGNNFVLIGGTDTVSSARSELKQMTFMVVAIGRKHMAWLVSWPVCGQCSENHVNHAWQSSWGIISLFESNTVVCVGFSWPLVYDRMNHILHRLSHKKTQIRMIIVVILCMYMNLQDVA